MKKILVDAYLAINLGDDLFLKILFERYPNCNFEIIHRNPQYKDIFKEYKNVTINNGILSKIQSKYFPPFLTKRYDAYINIGGSIFIEYPNWKELYNYRKKIIESFFKQKKPVYILGSNFGPYVSEEFLECYKSLFNKCNDICFRDQYSYNLFKGFSNVRLEPDIIFGLDFISENKIENSIGISIIDLNKQEHLKRYEIDYLEKIKEIIEEAISNNFKITLFSFCEKQGDLAAIKKVLELVNPEYKEMVNVSNYDGNIEKFLEQFSKMEHIIGTRFHASILSQVFKQGLYPLIYSNKTLNVLNDINLNEVYCEIKEITSLNVSDLLQKISENKIDDTIIFQNSKQQFKELDKYV